MRRILTYRIQLWYHQCIVVFACIWNETWILAASKRIIRLNQTRIHYMLMGDLSLLWINHSLILNSLQWNLYLLIGNLNSIHPIVVLLKSPFLRLWIEIVGVIIEMLRQQYLVICSARVLMTLMMMNLSGILRAKLPICVTSNVTYINLNLRLTLVIALAIETASTRHVESASSWRHSSSLMDTVKINLCLLIIDLFKIVRLG